MKYFWIKFCLTVPIGVFVLNTEHFVIIYGLLMMVIIDSILGTWVALKHQVFVSHKLRKIASKISTYSLALASMWIVCSVSPLTFGWMFTFFGVFLIMTEFISNLEKLSLLGLEIPSKLLSKINKNFNDYYYGNSSKKKESLKNILNKKL